MVTFSFDDSTRTATPISGLTGIAYGTEIAIDWQPFSFLTLRPSIDISNQDFQNVPRGMPGFSPPLNSSLYNIKLQALFDLAENWELDLFSSYLNSMDDKDLSTGFGFDARLAWQARKNLSIELIGSNLLTNIDENNFAPVEPSGMLRLTWDF